MDKNKKIRNFVGGAALAATLAFGGASAMPIVTHAQTATTTPSSSQTQGQQNGSQNQNGQQNPSGSNQNGEYGPMQGGPRGQGGPAGGQGGPGAGGPAGIGGTISAISGNTITLTHGNAVTVTVTVNSNTTYHEADKTISLSDLKTGENVNVHEVKNSDGTTAVDAVDVVLPHAGGTISAINGNTLTLTGPNNTTVTVNLSGSTTYSDLGKTISQSDLKSGERVDVAGTKNSDGSINAEVVNIMHDRTGGTVTAINGNSITIQLGGPGPNNQGGPRPPRNGNGAPNSASGSSNSQPSSQSGNTTPKTITITVDSNTTYTESGQAAQLSSIKVGDQIQAQGTRSSDGSSFSALQLEIQLPHYGGQVTSVSGSTITVQDRSGTHTITTNSNTKFLNGTATASLSDVKTGANINATGTVAANGTMTATQVQLGRPTPPAGAPMPPMQPPADGQQPPADGQQS